MGGCFSKKNKEAKPAAAVGSRDPPPTESPQEEKVKEVLSETPKITRQSSNKKKESNRGCGHDATVDRSEVSEEFSAASTTLTETTTATTITRGGAAEDEEDGEIEMKKKTRPAVTRSRSQKNINNRSDFNFGGRELHHRQVDHAAKREMRGVDVGCRSARSSPSPARTRAREKGNAAPRNRISSSAGGCGGGGHNNYSNYSKRDVGERSGRRSLSPAMKRSVAAAAAPAMDQRQCRSNANLLATATNARAPTNGRFSPARVPPPPASLLHLGEGRKGQDGNNVTNPGGGEDGNGLEAKESLENPLVSMECFIFL